MANYRDIIPFLIQAEGGLSDNRTDAGGLTNKGITFTTWLGFFPETSTPGETLARFKVMSPADWGVIFKKSCWDAFLGDDVKDPRIANEIAEWVYNSGKYYPERDIQQVINLIFKKHLDTDGNFGPATIETINSVDQDELYQDIIARHKQFYESLCVADRQLVKQKYPDVQDETIMARLAAQMGLKNLPNLKGWLSRVQKMQDFNAEKYPTPTQPPSAPTAA